jgi:hypothetical protein
MYVVNVILLMERVHKLGTGFFKFGIHCLFVKSTVFFIVRDLHVEW